jgi:amylosucrase
MYDSDETPKAYEQTLIDIFPETAPGSFTYYPDFKKWVWTTFNEHQWDLNWSNPEVLLEIVDIILNLANKGAEVLRLDAVAFMWKRLGTNCQNLPEVHDILQALRAATRIAAPAVIHKAEAIVAPRDLVPYLGAGRHKGREANLAYHNNLMVQYWSSLASGNTTLMTHTLLAHFPDVFRNASWATYIRCHDDIGWAITEEDAGAFPHMSGPGHRRFLADFYTGAFPGSFATGALFQENPATNDRRNSGSFASLAGLETALAAKDNGAIDLAIKRILLGNALIASFGGIPLLYMGDEIGLLNDHSYETEPDKARDNRWMHRPKMDWKLAKKAEKADSPAGWVLAGVRHIMAQRKLIPEFAASVPTRILRQPNPALFAFVRPGDSRTIGCVFNFTPHRQTLAIDVLASQGVSGREDLLALKPADIRAGYLELGPYQAVWVG